VTTSAEFREFIRDQLSVFGPVSIRRMFGGAGIYSDGIIFALIIKDTLYFKADAVSQTDFIAEGLNPFEYKGKSGKAVNLGYWRAPERCLDDPAEMAIWAEKAHAAAWRAARKKRNSKKV
jgi:DNA transformation protein